MKVLLGWELGAGQGHIQRLVALAQILETQGFEPVFALKAYKFKGISFSWQTVFAPRLPFLGRQDSYTFTDILENFGFGNVNLLRSHLQSWQSVLAEVTPSLIIADHAPGLVLAAYGKIPTIVIGECFTVPPLVESFPILRFPAPPESTQHQERVNATVRELVSDSPLGKLLNGDASFIFGIPELDPYQHLRDREKYVSLHITPIPRDLYRADGLSWAYLADHYPYRELVLQILKPQCEFKPLNEGLAGKSLAIHNGGLTTAIACLLTGIPQLILPIYLEQHLNAIALSQLGVAKIMTKPTWDKLLSAQAEASALSENAQVQAERLAHWNQNLRKIVVKTCLKLVGDYPCE